jgi:N-acylneuraminate cytidylyltransferase
VARSLGAEVPFMRSEKTSNDFATTEDALKEVIENYHKQGEEFELA